MGLAEEVKKLTEENKFLSENYKDLVHFASIGIYRSNKENRFTFANTELLKILGYTSFEELSKIDISKDLYCSSEDMDKFRNNIKKNHSVKGYELELKKADDSKIFVNITSRAIRDSNNEICYYEGLIEDITEKKLFEKMQQEGISNDRHSFRTPLNGILGFSEILSKESETLSKEEIEQYALFILEGANNMIYMTNHSLDISSMATGKYILKPQKFNLGKILENIDKYFIKHLKQKNMTLNYLVKENSNIEYYVGEEVRIKTVFLNLISNSINAGTENSEIKLFAEDLGNAYYFDLHNEGTMPDYVKNNFFESFVTKGGTGLGTRDAKLIVDAHKGKIEMTTSIENGTNIYLTLPKIHVENVKSNTN